MKNFLKKVGFCFFIIVLLNSAAAQPERKIRTPEEVIALVQKASAYLTKYGKEKALIEYSNPKGQFVDGELYLFAYPINGDGICLAHGVYPKLIGKNLLEMRDSDGVFIFKKFLEVANSVSGKGWVDYRWPNPSTRIVEQKTSYIERVQDIYIGSGIPKSIVKKK